MNIKELHERFKDDDSPSVEGQVRWLQKQGFAQHQIEQAMLKVYDEIDRGLVTFEGDRKGFRLDQYLLQTAKQIRTEELSQQIKSIEDFHARLKAQWEEDLRKKQRKPWYKRIFGL
jgi:uncharacterized protein (DUF2132 family)